MDSKKFGAFIANIRKERCMTQRELADQLNISDKAISKWETGEGFPEITIIPALAEILKVSVDELFKGEHQEQVSVQGHPPALAEHVLNSSMLKFNNFYMVAASLALLGLIAFFTITLVTYYEVIGFGVQLALILASVLLFGIAYNQLSNQAAKYNQMHPREKNCHAQDTGKKALATSIWLWVLSISVTLPYIIFDDNLYTKSIITIGTYLMVLPIFLIIGALIAWLICAKIYPQKLSIRARITSSKILRYGLASDLYWIIFIAIAFTYNDFPLVGLLLLACYLLLTAIFLFKEGRSLGWRVAVLLLVRNLLVGMAVNIAVSNNVYWFHYDNIEQVSINWDIILPAVWLILLLGILLLLGIKRMPNKKSKPATK